MHIPGSNVRDTLRRLSTADQNKLQLVKGEAVDVGPRIAIAGTFHADGTYMKG
jgi:hypothetical protein